MRASGCIAQYQMPARTSGIQRRLPLLGHNRHPAAPNDLRKPRVAIICGGELGEVVQLRQELDAHVAAAVKGIVKGLGRVGGARHVGAVETVGAGRPPRRQGSLPSDDAKPSSPAR